MAELGHRELTAEQMEDAKRIKEHPAELANTFVQAMPVINIIDAAHTARTGTQFATGNEVAPGERIIAGLTTSLAALPWVGAVRNVARAPRAIGYAPGTAATAVTKVSRIDHAGRHLAEFGVIAGNQGSSTFREAVRSNAIRILENPLKTFDHIMSQGGQAVKGFYGMIEGKDVVFFVAKEARGKIDAGDLVTAIVPSPQQIINWGLK